MLIPTAIIGIEQGKHGGFFVRDPQTNALWPKPFASLDAAVTARDKAEKVVQTTVKSPVSVLYVGTMRQIKSLAAEVQAYDELLNHPILNPPEAKHV